MNKTICIIDDDIDVRSVMCYALEFEGYKTLPFENPKLAEEYLAQLSPSLFPCLMIIDYMMPVMSGLEFIHHVRGKYPQTIGKIPMALSTARITDDEECPKDVMVLAKPLDLNLLLSVVAKFAQRESQALHLA